MIPGIELEPGRRIIEWYRKNARDLPWRPAGSPYEVLVSEMMLQQTRVETVEKRYTDFIERFPTVESLAAADEEEVLNAWQGLGYYRRATNLHKAARYIVANCGGVIPSEREELLKVPGIGEYTAGAVRAIAYGQLAVAVDANALRIMARALKIDEPVRTIGTQRIIGHEMIRWVPLDDPGGFAQAMMDLGSAVCRPREPLCDDCPIQDLCAARKDGLQHKYPVKQPQKEQSREEWAAVCLMYKDRMAFVRRPTKGLLAGMHGPPMLAGRPTEEGVRGFAQGAGIKVLDVNPGPEWTHTFTHIKWDIVSWIVRADKKPDSTLGFLWVSRDSLRETLAVPSAFRPIVEFWERSEYVR